MKDYIEIGGFRYKIEYMTVLVPGFTKGTIEKTIPVLKEIPFDSYSDKDLKVE